LDQIAVFREASARRDREKKQAEDDRERFKAGQAMDSNTVDYGYGNSRGLSNQLKKERTWGNPNQNQAPNQQNHGQNQGPGQSHGHGQNQNGRERDPQGYDQPVNFVKAQAPESKEQSDRTDEEDEQIRVQRREREKASALKEVGHIVPTDRG
jgi:RNA-binding protein 25